MKKKILLIIAVIFCFIGTVKADQFYLKYKTDKSYADIQDAYPYKEGFVFIDSTYPSNKMEALVEYRNNQNEVIKSKYFADYAFIDVVTDDENIYLIGKDNTRDTGSKIYKLDQDFNIVGSISIGFDVYESDLDNGDNLFRIENNMVTFSHSKYENNKQEFYVWSIDKNLTESTDVKLEDSNLFEDLKYRNAMEETFLLNNRDIIEVEKYEDNFLVSSGEYGGLCKRSNNSQEKGYTVQFLEAPACENNTIIGLYDKDGNKIWEHKYDSETEYNNINNIRVKAGRIVAIASNDSEDNLKQVVNILYFDESGKLIQKIDNQILDRLELGEKSLVVNTGEKKICKASFPYDNNSFCQTVYNYHTVYLLEYEIENVVKGNGKVTSSVNKSKSGETITFTVEPEEGYVLSEVRVTDANGNIVTFTENTFTMPSADVTIEATFVLAEKEEVIPKEPEKEEESEPKTIEEKEENPNTSDIFIFLILTLAITAAIVILIEGKRIKNLI